MMAACAPAALEIRTAGGTVATTVATVGCAALAYAILRQRYLGGDLR